MNLSENKQHLRYSTSTVVMLLFMKHICHYYIIDVINELPNCCEALLDKVIHFNKNGNCTKYASWANIVMLVIILHNV